nr:GNAT family N-acetyltransferase [Microbacterium bovistercoris]
MMNETLSALDPSLRAMRLEELTSGNIDRANQLSVKPGQEKFVLPVTYSLIVTPFSPMTSWQRVAVVDDQVVGFIHANLDPNAAVDEYRACIWRIYVDAAVQGQGVGSFMIHAFSEVAAGAGLDRITVMWEPGLDSPGEAFHRIGFTDIGRTEYGEIIGALASS